MNESLRDMMMRTKMCANCGLVDEDGGVDFTGSGLSWYCQEHLDQRDDAALLPSQRVTTSWVL